MESYILCKNHIGKLIKTAFSNFPHQPDVVIKEVSKVLKGLFMLRMINRHFNFDFKFPKIDNNMNVNKMSGSCDFNFDKYIKIYMNVNKLKIREDEILDFVQVTSEQMNLDNRYNMNGHDFIEVLFHYLNKIKNTSNFRQENFEKAVHLTIQPNYLDDYDLFKTISK